MADNEITVGDYKLLSCLAQGKNSQVWEAVAGEATNRVAFKLLLPEAFADRELRQSMKYEAKVAKALDHPNIIKVIEVVVNRKHAFIAMDLFRAPNVKGQLHGNLNSLHLRARKLIKLTSEALRHMHERGWIHKDIKPENILINKSSEVRLIDFSLAGKPSSSIGQMVGRKKSGNVQGTRTYMSPEQIRNKPLSIQTDIYGLGVTVYEILAGRPPFRSPHPDELLMEHLKTVPWEPSAYNENITPEMDQIVLKMLAKKPQNRYQNIDEFLTEFRGVKIFKEAIQEEVILTEEEREQKLLEDPEASLDSRLDSRMDAMRSAAQKRDPNYVPPSKPVIKKRPVASVPEEQPPQQPEHPPQQQPMQPQPLSPQQHQEMQHQAMQQQAAYQQAMQQQAMYQQAMQQQAMYQQQQFPQQQFPQQQFPQQPMPGQPMPGQPMMQPPVPTGMHPPQQPPPTQQPAQAPPAQTQEPTPAVEKAAEEPKPAKAKEVQGTVMNISDLDDMFNALPDVN